MAMQKKAPDAIAITAIVTSAPNLIVNTDYRRKVGGLMSQFIRMTVIVAMLFGLAACGGDKKESTDNAAEAQKAIQQGMQKEKAMMEGMQKGVESVEKKATEESKK